MVIEKDIKCTVNRGRDDFMGLKGNMFCILGFHAHYEYTMSKSSADVA